MEAQAEEQAAESQKERKLRERNEQYSRQLEEELEGLKVSVQTHTLLNINLFIYRVSVPLCFIFFTSTTRT